MCGCRGGDRRADNRWEGGLLWETLFEEGKRWKNEKESWEMAMVGRKMKADAKSKGYR